MSPAAILYSGVSLVLPEFAVFVMQTLLGALAAAVAAVPAVARYRNMLICVFSWPILLFFWTEMHQGF